MQCNLYIRTFTLSMPLSHARTHTRSHARHLTCIRYTVHIYVLALGAWTCTYYIQYTDISKNPHVVTQLSYDAEMYLFFLFFSPKVGGYPRGLDRKAEGYMAADDVHMKRERGKTNKQTKNKNKKQT